MRRVGSIRRPGEGLGALALLSLASLPICLHIASVHRSHWIGGSAGGYWDGFVVPTAGRAWAIVCVVAVAGWAASASTSDPRLARRIGSGAARGALACIVAAAASIPAWIWLARFDVVPDARLVGLFVVRACAVIVAGVSAGAFGGAVPFAPAALGGAVLGGTVIGWTWALAAN